MDFLTNLAVFITIGDCLLKAAKFVCKKLRGIFDKNSRS